MRRRRVKITGIGPVTPAGIGKDAFWRGILEPVSRVRPYKALGEEYGPLVAAHITKFDIRDYIHNGDGVLLKGAARHTLFAAAGATLALKDAGITKEEFSASNGAIVIGTSLMDFGGICRAMDVVNKRGMRAAHGYGIFRYNLAAIPDTINRLLGSNAHSMVMQSSCCSGLDAIGYAAELIAKGEADIAICGGTEAPLHRHPLIELRMVGLTPPTEDMPERLARPFDLWRTTGVVSEGACIFVIECEESPREGYSHITGYAFANDASDCLCGGMAEAGKLAIAGAGIRPSDVEYISAWGPGHKMIDAAESRAMISLFGSALMDIPCGSIKGAIGAPFGAAPAMQVGVAALAQQSDLMPPTVNWQHPDPECPLCLSNNVRSIPHDVTLINAHGIAGVNASLVLEKC
ncbi:MAG: hypothetical protein HZA31_05135 [Opitutae bacterium]|nr:hypothetical protein [Opitutae bacterium]